MIVSRIFHISTYKPGQPTPITTADHTFPPALHNNIQPTATTPSITSQHSGKLTPFIWPAAVLRAALRDESVGDRSN